MIFATQLHDPKLFLDEQIQHFTSANNALREEISLKMKQGTFDMEPHQSIDFCSDFLFNVNALLIEYETLLNIHKAVSISNYYTQKLEEFYASNPDLPKSFLRCMVRYKGKHIAIIWVRQMLYAEKSRTNKNFRVFSVHLKKGVGHKYPDSFAKKEIDFVSELALKCEASFAKIRKRLAELGALRRTQKYPLNLKEIISDLD